MERETDKDESRFLYYAKSSSGELLTQTCIDIGYIDNAEGKKIITECRELSAMIAALIKLRKGFVREGSEQYTVEPRT